VVRLLSERIQFDFENLPHLVLTSISFHLSLNLNETGFRSSKSVPAAARKVIVLKRLATILVFNEGIDFHCFATLCVISASGNGLMSGLITKREKVIAVMQRNGRRSRARTEIQMENFCTARDFL
jgi:hypothetical protein